MNYPVINHHYHHVVAAPGSSISYSATIPGIAAPYIHTSFPSPANPILSCHPQQIQAQHPLSSPVSSAIFVNGHYNPYFNHASPASLRAHLPSQQAIYPAALPHNTHVIHPHFVLQQAKHLPLQQSPQIKEINLSPAQVAHKLQVQYQPQQQQQQQELKQPITLNIDDEASQQTNRQRNNRGMMVIMPTTKHKFSVSDSEIDPHTHSTEVVTPILDKQHEKYTGDCKSVVTTTASSSSTVPDDSSIHDERDLEDEEDNEDDNSSESLSRIGYGESVPPHKQNKRKREGKDSKSEGVLTNVLKKVCDNCIKLKKKCKKDHGSDQCETCEKKGLPCHFARQKKRGRVFGTVIATRIKRAPNEPLPPSATYDADYLAGLQLKLGNCIQLLQQISEVESKDDHQ